MTWLMVSHVTHDDLSATRWDRCSGIWPLIPLCLRQQCFLSYMVPQIWKQRQWTQWVNTTKFWAIFMWPGMCASCNGQIPSWCAFSLHWAIQLNQFSSFLISLALCTHCRVRVVKGHAVIHWEKATGHDKWWLSVEVDFGLNFQSTVMFQCAGL